MRICDLAAGSGADGTPVTDTVCQTARPPRLRAVTGPRSDTDSTGAGGWSLPSSAMLRRLAVTAEHRRGRSGPGLLLGGQRVRRQVGPRHGIQQLRQPIAGQAAFLQQYGDRRLIAERSAVIECPPLACRRRQGRGECRLGARLVVRQGKGRAELRFGQRRRQSVDPFGDHAGGAGTALAGHGQHVQPVSLRGEIGRFVAGLIRRRRR